MTPIEFIRKWRAADLSERAAAQEHFIDLCRLVDHPTPAEDDPTGDHFAFEKGVTKTGGGDGFADVWKKGFFAWEYKKKKRNLDAALEQLSRYAAALEYPPLHVACDIDRFVIVAAWTNTVPERHVILLEDLADPDKLRLLYAVFHEPERLRPQRTRQALTAEAAGQFVQIAESLQRRESDTEAVAHFISQLVFCFFAEDVRLLPEGFFSRILRHAFDHPERSKEYLDRLFDAMASGGEFDLTDIRHFNGGLFDGRAAFRLQQDELALLVAVGSLDWEQIDPTIFGTLFERFLDPEKRAQIGAHYTDTDKIMMIVEPVILRPLREEWEKTRAQIEAVLRPIADLGRGLTRSATLRIDRQIVRLRGQAEAIREVFLERLRSLTILDPACGSGNFLYLALRGVKDLEHRANLECEALGLVSRLPIVGPEILHGIELNRHAAELARTTIWIGHIQWGLQNGFHAWPSPILQRLDAIVTGDALIAQVTGDDNGWRESRWPSAEFVIGNPPFLGGKLLRSGLGDEYVERMFTAFSGRVPAEADLVVYWVVKAHEMINEGRCTRAGLVTTNSIRGGANRRALDAIVSDGLLFEAWSDEPWVIEGAAVRVSLVLFGRHAGELCLDGHPVEHINADLSAESTDLTRAQQLETNAGIAFMGDTKGGGFDVPGRLARRWLQQPVNPNGRSNSDVLKPWINGMDITRRNRDMWIIDFGWTMPESQCALFEMPWQHVVATVRPERVKNRRAAYAANWWRHAEPRPAMWGALEGLGRYIVTPRVSRHRIFVWVYRPTCPDSATIAIARDDDAIFGLLHSRFHEAWSLRLGTWLGVGNDPRYTPTTTFETFPFPDGLTPDVPASSFASDPRAARIAVAAKRLDDLRNVWLNPPDLVRTESEVVTGFPDRLLPRNAEAEAQLRERTLTKLYNARPQWLNDAHAEIDRAVAAAYGWPEDIATDDALARLLGLNLSRSGRLDQA